MEIDYEEFKKALEMCYKRSRTEKAVRVAMQDYKDELSMVGCPSLEIRVNVIGKSCIGRGCGECWKLCIDWCLANMPGFWEVL